MVDPKQAQLEITVAGQDFDIMQSPGLLQSKRGGGTTGAAVWQVTVRFAEWLAAPDNILFATGTLDSESTVLELGAGTAGIIPSILSRRVRRVIATDQDYILKSLRENISANMSRKKRTKTAKRQDAAIDVLPLDWENDDVSVFLRSGGLQTGVDLIVACDCVYNYALIPPLTQTCIELCRGRSGSEGFNSSPTMCLIVQQLRQPEVFQEWLTAFYAAFRVWRLSDEFLTADLSSDSGFVVHLGVLQE